MVSYIQSVQRHLTYIMKLNGTSELNTCLCILYVVGYCDQLSRYCGVIKAGQSNIILGYKLKG